MKKALIAVLVLGLLGTGSYGAYHHFFKDAQTESGRVSSDSEDAVYVDAVSAITGYGSGNGLIQRFAGEVEPQATLEIKLEGDKSVDECFVKEGDVVKEGQRLFTYDTREAEDNLSQAEIDLERLESDIEVSERQIKQFEKELKNAEDEDERLSIETDIMSLQTSIKRYEFEIKQKKLEMEGLKESIDSATVTADMGGRVQKITDANNEDSYSYSYSDSAAYITILAEGDFRIKGSANEQAVNLGLIYSGMPVIAFSRVDNSLMWKGVITEVDTSNSEEDSEQSMYYYYGNGSGESSSYSFYVELEHSDGLILGQHVYMEEDKGQDQQKDGLWLEEYYLFEEEDSYFVWKAGKNNLIEKQEVVIGEYDDELLKYEILEGLDAEDYIAYPQSSVLEGCPVIYNDYSSTDDFLLEDDGSYEEDWGEEDWAEEDWAEEDWAEEDWEEDWAEEDWEEEWAEEDWAEEDWDEEDWDEGFDPTADMGAALFSMEGDVEYDAPEEFIEEGTYMDSDDAVYGLMGE